MVEVVVIIFITALLLGYAVLIENYRRWFLEVNLFTNSTAPTSLIRFSIVIPARNEEAIIEACLTSVLSQEYDTDLFEVIIIDDHSSDNTVRVVQTLQRTNANLRVIKLEELLQGKQLNSYKKKAIEYAIENSVGDWIITTDADCIVSPTWLKTLASFIIQRDPVFVAAPVKLANNGSFISIFQCLDFMTLQGITAAAVDHKFHSMCNGANLAYNKKVFNEVGGFAGIDNIASGDDMLLMHKIFERYPTRVSYLLSQDVIVETPPMLTWKAFFNQRIRWASKADKYKDNRIFWVLFLVYVLNLSFLALPILSLWHTQAIFYWAGMLIAKTLIELRFIYPVAVFFKEQQLLWWFPIMQPAHIAYTVIAGWLGKFGNYTWKGRTVS